MRLNLGHSNRKGPGIAFRKPSFISLSLSLDQFIARSLERGNLF